MNNERNNNMNPLGTVRHVETMNAQKFREKSLAGQAIRRERTKKRQIERENYERRKNNIIATAITAALAFGSIASLPHVAAKIQDWQIKNDPIVRITDEYDQVISSSISGRSADGLSPLYKYYEIAQYINDSGHFDNGLFATYKAFSLGTDLETNEQISQQQVIHELNQVLQYTEYNNFQNYLKIKGYKDIQEYEEDMTKKIKLEDSIKKEKEKSESELKKMNEELQEIIEEHSLTNSEGGKNL